VGVTIKPCWVWAIYPYNPSSWDEYCNLILDSNAIELEGPPSRTEWGLLACFKIGTINSNLGTVSVIMMETIFPFNLEKGGLTNHAYAILFGCSYMYHMKMIFLQVYSRYTCCK